jgi:hypothetical protein
VDAEDLRSFTVRSFRAHVGGHDGFARIADGVKNGLVLGSIHIRVDRIGIDQLGIDQRCELWHK